MRVIAVSWRFMRHCLRVEKVLGPAPPPPQHAGQPVRQDPEGEEPQEDHQRRGDDVAYELRAGQVSVDLREEVLDA